MHEMSALQSDRSVRSLPAGFGQFMFAGALVCASLPLSVRPALAGGVGFQASYDSTAALTDSSLLTDDAYKAACASALQRYPAAGTTPREAIGVPTPGKVESAAPPDETAKQFTPGGVKIFKRDKRCFPTENRNLFSEVDKVAVTVDGKPELRPMDYLDKTGVVPENARNAIRGQNTWMLWGEGNDAFWGWVQQHGYGIVDFLVLLDSNKRETRFADTGMINQPGMKANKNPLPGLGVFIDQADGDKIVMQQPPNDLDVGNKLAVNKPIPATDPHRIATIRVPASGANAGSTQPVASAATSGDKAQEKKQDHLTEFFEIGDETAYANSIRALPKDDIDPLVYGYPSGVVGLRLFPNPDFFGKSDAASAARKYWDEKVVRDETHLYYFNPRNLPDDPEEARKVAQTAAKAAALRADPKLIRPFRVSMACAFCHVGPHPLAPPDNPEHPAWGNLSSMIGNQYWSPPEIFSNTKATDSFLWQFVESQQPGTIDTSLVATDHINNPNTINAIFEVNARLDRAQANPEELQSALNVTLRSIEDPAPSTTASRHTPRVLLDGADSVGIEGALLRVYLNIGAYSEQWRDVQNTIIGFAPQRPFDLATIRAKSGYWNTTEQYRVSELESFFTYAEKDTDAKAKATVAQPMKLETAPGGAAFLAAGSGQVEAGRKVFLNNCAICHSSKQPANSQIEFSRNWRNAGTNGGTLTLPMDFADWDAFKKSPQYSAYVARLNAYLKSASGGEDEFFKDNYLSNDVRVPVTLVGTNSQRAVATNGMRGQVWDNFSSDTYKALPAVGLVHFFNPFKTDNRVDPWGNNDTYSPPGGGPGYYRPASLVSLWATAPLLHNNALGIYTRNPSVESRVAAFDDAIDKLLHKSKRTYTIPPATDTAAKHPAESSGQASVRVTSTSEQSPAQASSFQKAETRKKPLRNEYPDSKTRDDCHKQPETPSAACDALRGDFRRTFEEAGIAGQPGFRDVGFIFRTTRDSYLDFEGPFIRPLLDGIMGSMLVSFLSFYLWLILAAVALILAFVGRPRLAGSLLAIDAALLGALIHVTGLDTVCACLWIAPALLLIGAALFFRNPAASGTARALFVVSAIAFIALGIAGKRFVDGDAGGIRLGPIPRGTPVNLIMNINPDAPTLDLLNAAGGLARGLARMQQDNLNDGTFKALDDFQKEAASVLLKASKCPDFVLDRGHWFGESLSEDDKKYLKAFLKTL
jgi:cytochrome c5